MGNSKIVLVVEDSADDADLTVRALRSNGDNVEVVVVRDGVEALDYLFHENQRPDGSKGLPNLVLLDLKLPKVGGIDVLRRIRSDPRTKLLPVIILSSSREEVDIVSGYREGANSYIRKPVEFEAFRQAMREVRAYWLELTELPPASPSTARPA